MLKHRIAVGLSLAVIMAVNPGCKSRTPVQSKAASADDYPTGNPLSTPELHAYLKSRIEKQAAKATVDDGSNPSEDVWEYYIDHLAANKLWGINLRNSRDMFGVPLSALRFPEGTPLPDPCPEENKLTVDGKAACLAMDNLMRYVWEPKAKGKHLQNSKDWFVHLIPQFYGSKQPAMQKFIREGDIIVYFHPEKRKDNPSSIVQWRTTHAATIIKRESDGALMTVDTPTGYAQPFNGTDSTPFHVFRFIPRDFQDWKVADEYGKQIARWGTLGFGKFSFQGDYGVMAQNMLRESDIDKFVDGYLKAARTGEKVLPNMYCAWFAWTNLNLGWMRPMTPNGLGKARYDSLVGETFPQIYKTHSYEKGDFDKGYAVPASLQNRMSKRQNFAVMPMTAPELMLGFLDRLAGRTTDASTAAEFIAVAKIKAAMLAAFSEPNAGVVRTFQVESRELEANETPTPQDEYNGNIQRTFQAFAEKFEEMATKVGSGQLDVKDAQKEINTTFTKLVKDEWTTNLNVSRKWIPPYGFIHHAEYGYENYNVQDKAQPVLAYVGTVFHEKFLRKNGEQPGSRKMSILQESVATPDDLSLDKQIYERLGCSPQDDGNGWKALLEHLDPTVSSPSCGTRHQSLVQFNSKELRAVKEMINAWPISETPSERATFVHNTFGLDNVLMRRLLVSFWNDPTQYFKPAIYEGEASTIDSAVLNLRILLGNETMTMNQDPADQSKYNTDGHPRRSTTIPCIAFAQTHIPCDQGPWVHPFSDN